MMETRGVGVAATLGVVALSASLMLMTSASRLNPAWLVPAGNVRLDFKALAQPEMKICALTFDDGPDGKYTPQVAAILRRYNVPATFFVIGLRLAANPKVIEDLAASGFEIGDHSQDHPQMSKLSPERQRNEIKQVQEALAKKGITTHWFRPPYGAFNATTVSAASKLGLETVLWSVDPRDWSEPGVSRIQSRVLSAVTPGAVILLHSTHGQTVEALPGIIEGLQKRGYRFVTMSEWARDVSGSQPLAAQADVMPSKNAGAPPPGLQVEPDEAVRLPDEASNVNFSSGVGAAPPVTNETVTPAEPAPVTAAPPAAPAPAPAPQPNVSGISPAAANAAFVVRANFDGPEQAEAILHGSTGGKLRQWLSSLEQYGGAGGYLAHLLPGMLTLPPQPPPMQDIISPAANAPLLYPLSGDGAWGGKWQPATTLDLPSILSAEKELSGNRFRPAPHYYLLTIGNYSSGDIWEGLTNFYDLARLDGLLISDPATASTISDSSTTPHLVTPPTQLAPGAMVDLSLQNLGELLENLHSGYGNIYLTVRPSTIDGYSASALNSLGASQREFILFRRLTAGLNYDAAPENDFAPQWPLPAGIHLARFFDSQREVLILYSTAAGNTSFGLPSAARPYMVAQFDEQDHLVLRPLVETSAVLAHNVLVLYRELH